MNEESNKILGCVKLGFEYKPIILLNDVFLNYTFSEKDYWETLREMVNIFYDAYNGYYKHHKYRKHQQHEHIEIKPIEGKIRVITQFPYYKDADSTTPKRQDAKIISESKCDYIEFQNDMYPTPKIKDRSIDYFGFSVSRGEKETINNMWLLNGTVSELLDGNTFSNYILMNEINYQPHPNRANILYVNLEQLAKDSSRAGELAGVLIGEVKDPKYREVDRIFQSFKDSFEEFKNDTEVCDILSRVEELKAEGRAEVLPVIAEKNKELAEQAEQLVEKDEELAEQAEKLAEQAERIRKLEAQIVGNLS